MRSMIVKASGIAVATLALVVLITCYVPAQAAPNSTTYQGMLTDANGQAVPDSTYQVQFRLHTLEIGGTAFLTTTTQSVQTRGGLFAAQISPITSTDLVGRSSVWLETWMASPSTSLKALSPRAKLSAVPYALVVPWSGVEGAPTAFPPTGAAGGDLSGAYPNPSISNASVTSAKIADGTITNADISSSAAIADTKIAGSGTAVVNLNADKLDGFHAADLTATSSSPIKQVVRGTIDFSPANYDLTQTFSPTVNPAKSIVSLFGPVNIGGNTQTLNYQACLISLTTSQIRIAVDKIIQSGLSFRVGYQIVEYN